MIKLSLVIVLSFMVCAGASAKRVNLVSMGRNFVVVIPDQLSKGPKPLLVLLHGCKQSPSLILEGTQLEVEANKNGFIILAPEQPNYYNMDHCWNWFLDFQQQRHITTEMGQIISGIDAVSKIHPVDVDKIFVTGISAGGVMAHNLTACYPDVFSGSAIHSGLSFKVAESVNEAQTVLTSYEQKSPEYLGKKMYECSREAKKKKLSKVLIIHGREDSRVPSLHSELISKSQAVWRDYLDDGKDNNSVRGVVKSETISLPGTYSVEQTDIKYPGFHERMLMIKGLGHAWGGGKPVSVNFDPKAPSSNQFILDYFELIK
jgi:poly(hydroxyalkanoate) depolymerase family esterase